jgi:hypothetical protein
MRNTLVILNNNSKIYSPNIKAKLSYVYDNVSLFFIDENLNYSKHEIIQKINSIINEKNIFSVYFQGDYLSLINHHFINKINCEKKFLMVTDDFDTHEVNSINSLAVNSVIATDPIDVYNYKTKSLNAEFWFLEGSKKIFYNTHEEKIYDVIFFGALKADRKEYLDFLISKKINVKIIEPSKYGFLQVEEIVTYINKSKIVLNFSKAGKKNKFYSHKTYPFEYYNIKGRIMMSALCDTFCLSENSPSLKIIYENNQIPTFKNKEEMYEKINFLLNNEKDFEKIKLNFINKLKKYEDSIYFPILHKKIVEQNNRKKVDNLPLWYLRIYFIKSYKMYGKTINFMPFIKTISNNINECFAYNKQAAFFLIPEGILYFIYISCKILLNKIKN